VGPEVVRSGQHIVCMGQLSTEFDGQFATVTDDPVVCLTEADCARVSTDTPP
jgi:hypothetical protein